MCVVIIWRFFLKFDAFIPACIYHERRLSSVFLFLQDHCQRPARRRLRRQVAQHAVIYDAKLVISTVNCDDRKAYENDYGLFQVRVFVYLRVLKKNGFYS